MSSDLPRWARHPWRALSARLGRRGAVLCSFGFIWILIGFGYYTIPPLGVTLAGLAAIVQVMALKYWGLVWVAAGLTGMVAAFCATGRDMFGFVALSLMPLAWSVSFMIAFLSGNGRAGLSASIFLALLVPLFIVAGWPEYRYPEHQHVTAAGGHQSVGGQG